MGLAAKKRKEREKSVMLFSAKGVTPYQDFAPKAIRAESPHHRPVCLWNGLSALMAVSTKVLARWP